MIEGTPIAKEFKKIYACSYLYNVDGIAFWPGVAVSYTTKTQFLFKINKGIDSIYDNKLINKYVAEDERKIPFEHMIYFGDGETDIPCMKLVKQKGGHSIAVYKPRDSKKKMIAENLILEGRVNFVCPAEYTKGKEIHLVVKTILDKIKADYDFKDLLKKHQEKCKVKKSEEINFPENGIAIEKKSKEIILEGERVIQNNRNEVIMHEMDSKNKKASYRRS